MLPVRLGTIFRSATGSLNLTTRTMSSSAAPTFKKFNIALIQLGQVGADKSRNLAHAKEMILKAAAGDANSHIVPDLIVLPVCEQDNSLAYQL